MVDDLKNREEDAANYDGGNPSWYSGSASRESDQNQDTPDKTGKVKNANELEDAENTAPAASSRGLFSKSNSKEKSRFRLNKKQGIIGTIVGLLTVGGLGIGLFSIGPLTTVHASQLFQKFHFSRADSFMDDRSGRFLRNLAAGTPARGRLGYASDKFASRWENRLIRDAGIKSVYGKNQRFIGYQIVDAGKAQGFLSDLEADGINRSAELNQSAVDIDGNPVDNAQGDFIDLSDDRLKNRRSVIRSSTRALGVSRLSSSLGSRLLIKRGGIDFAPFKNLTRRAGESFTDFTRRVRDSTAERYRTGISSRRVQSAVVEETNQDGETQRSADPSSSETLEDINNTDLDSSDGRSNIRGNLKTNVAAKLGGAAAAVGVLCMADSLGDQADVLKQEQIAVMMRMGMDVVTSGSQIMAMDNINLGEIGAITTKMHDGETSFFSARSIQHNSGQEATGPDIPDHARIDSLESEPLVFRVIGAIPGFGGVCAVEEEIGNLPIIKQVGDFVEGSINVALRLFNTSTEELAESAVRMISGELVNVDAQGAELGALADYGVALASNEQMLSVGGSPLSETELAAINQELHQEESERFVQQGFIARVFNVFDVRSVFGRLSYTASTLSFRNILTHPVRVLGLAVSPTVFAQNTYDYGFPMYGFSIEDQEDERVSDPFENAAWVEQGDRLNVLNSTYGECFGMEINPDTGALESSEGSFKYAERADMPECETGSADAYGEEGLLRFRFYLADMVTDHTLACYEGASFSCQQIGVTGDSRSSRVDADGQIVGDPYTDGVDISCAPGTNDLGIADGYTGGSQFNIRLCSVTNIPSNGSADNPGGRWATDGAEGNAIVNSRVSGAWYALAEAASADGIDLRAVSSFRSNEHQTSLYNACLARNGGTCNSVAPPGRSSHQAGVAIDFTNMDFESGAQFGRTCADPMTADTAEHRWMRQNAYRFGFKQLSFESWHWDALNLENRCDYR